MLLSVTSSLLDRLFHPDTAFACEWSAYLNGIFDWNKAPHTELADPEERLRAIITDAKSSLPPRQDTYRPAWRRSGRQLRDSFADRLFEPHCWRHDSCENRLNEIFDELQAPYDGTPFSASLRLRAIIEAARQPQLTLAP